MKNSLRRIFALALVVMMIAALGMSVAAEDGEGTATVIDKVTFTKELTKDAKAYAPDTDFVFTIVPYAAEGANGTAEKPYAGPATGALFATTADDKTSLSISASECNETEVIGATKLTYNAIININVGAFTDAGVYRYKVTETNSAYAGITYDTAERYLIVAVVDNGTDLEVAAAFMYTGANDKTAVFANEYTTGTVTVEKTVSGNTGEKDKGFVFQVRVTSANDEQYYVTDKAGNMIGTIDANAEEATEITLKHGESFTIHGLSTDDTYSVVENDYSGDGYKTTVDNKEANSVSNLFASTVKHVFNNDRTVNVPTGIAMTVLPFVAMIALAAIVAVLFFQKRERREA